MGADPPRDTELGGDLACRRLGSQGKYVERVNARDPCQAGRYVGGMVRGTCDNVRALMRDRQTILIFPGGSREVNKRRGQQYQLLPDCGM